MQLTEDQLTVLKDIAEKNDGHCDRCGRVLKIYTYKISAGHARTLRAIADHTNQTGKRAVNLNNLDDDIAYSAATQRTKMRLHGLIAKHKENGVHVASTWVITTKGWDFLRGEKILSKVIVFDNQVLGHGTETTTINRLTGDDLTYTDETISPAEAEVLHDVRAERKHLKFFAQYKGIDLPGLEKDTAYEIEVDGLRTGKPIEMISPFEYQYSDIAEFRRTWSILKEVKP